MAAMTEAEVAAGLGTVQGWRRQRDEITKEYSFTDFAGSMVFVNKVADAAQAADHHPDIAINYNRVTLTLSTHSEGGLTQKDFALARQIDAIG